MPNSVFTFGEIHPDFDPGRFTRVEARKVLAVLKNSSDFEVLGIGYARSQDGAQNDLILVDCLNEQVPTKNPFGIRRRERLAFVFGSDESKGPEVRALRRDFPRSVPHLNHFPEEEPASLCLYFEPWRSVRRSWTPQLFLRRIIWWLAETSRGKLHRPDQPVEVLYLNNPVEIVLPPNLDALIEAKDKILVFTPVDATNVVIRGKFTTRETANTIGKTPFIPIIISLNAVLQGAAEPVPGDLGKLCDQLEARDVPFLHPLMEKLIDLTPETGVPDAAGEQCLLILPIQIVREVGGAPEGYQLKGYIIKATFGELGKAFGVLHKIGDAYCKFALLGGGTQSASSEWRNLKLIPVDVKLAATKELVYKASGLTPEESEFKGVLAGVGALGGTLADLWAKSSWGQWTLVDPDIVKVHNIPRHICRDRHIGLPKVQVVKEAMESNYEPGYYHAGAISADVTDQIDQHIPEAFLNASLLIDATTTIEIPRDLSANDSMPRCASVFLTPSSQGSVLLFENSDRTTRLDALEAQYYRAVINNEWGKYFLTNLDGVLWVGAGCRDVSSVIPNDMVHIHASTLAKQVRQQKEQPEAKIGVWISDQASGAMIAEWIQVMPVFRNLISGWTVVWDCEVKSKLKKFRIANAPNETGGVIVGFIDHIQNMIYVVDVLPAPPDSEGTPSGFIRGVEGLKTRIEDIGRRTALVVGYIGEWHSHPPFCSARPSGLDRRLLQFLGDQLAEDGHPALMMIVGSDDVHLSVHNTDLPIRDQPEESPG